MNTDNWFQRITFMAPAWIPMLSGIVAKSKWMFSIGVILIIPSVFLTFKFDSEWYDKFQI